MGSVSTGHRWIERAATTVAAGAVLLTIATAITVTTPLLRSRGERREGRAAYTTGDRIDIPASVYQDRDHTVILFARGSCGACQNAQAIYADLIADLKQRRTNLLLISGAHSSLEDRAYADGLGLAEDDHLRLDLSGLRLRRVPTLVVVDRRGIVLGSWEGAPPESQRLTFVPSVTSVLPH
jgi:hypothetical protein